MLVEIYSDVVCPWCYIGERRFERALAAFPRPDAVTVAFRPFQLDPDAPAQATPLIESLHRKFGAAVPEVLQRVSEAGRGEGIEFDWQHAVAANTFDAHRLLRLVEQEHEADVQRALAERLFEAHFTRGANVADHEVLAAIAAAVGMDEGRVRRYLASDDGADAVREGMGRARAMGIRAVPTFVLDGRYMVQGAQSPATFLAALEEVAARAAADGEQAAHTVEAR